MKITKADALSAEILALIKRLGITDDPKEQIIALHKTIHKIISKNPDISNSCL